MRIIGIDSTTKNFCLGIYDDGKIFEYHIELGTKLATQITMHISRAFKALGWQLKDIDYLACGVGPGSFTGTRVGIATIKGLSWAIKKPIIGIPSLDILAMNAGDTNKPIIAAVDARRNLLYCGFYKKQNGVLKRIKSFMLLNIEDFRKQAKPGSVIVGDATGLYREAMQANINGVTMLDKDYWYPKARHLMSLALELAKVRKTKDAFNIKPIYLYPKECQIIRYSG